jgi:hypothetical protein
MALGESFTQEVLAAEQAGVLPAYLTQHFSTRGGTFGLFAEQILACLSDDQDDTIHRLHAALPDSFALRFITHYAVACLAARADDVRATHAELCHAVRIGAAGQGLFAQDMVAQRLWYGALQQAFAIDPRHPALLSPPARLAFTPSSPGSPVVLSSCNGDYFDHFGPEFLASAASIAGLRCHIHVVNPTATTETLFAHGHAQSKAELSLSCDQGPTEASYYACKRFLIAGDLMDRFASDLIVTDIDTVLRPALLTLPQLAGAADGGMFERAGRTAPMEICHCSLTYFRRTETTRRFLQLLATYLAPKLDEYGTWMLDQSSLFTLTRLARREPESTLWAGVPQLRWFDFSTLPGIALDAVNPNQVSAQDVAGKHVLRRTQSMGDVEIGLAADGRPSFVRTAPAVAAA